MASSAALEDYISSFENSIILSGHSTHREEQVRPEGKGMRSLLSNPSVIHYNEERKQRPSQYQLIDDVPTRDNNLGEISASDKQRSEVGINFKDFYELSKLGKPLVQATQPFTLANRSKSSFQSRDFKTSSQNVGPKINYNINDYLPSAQRQIAQNTLYYSPYRLTAQENSPQVSNVFKYNVQQSQFGQMNNYSPIRINPLLQCSCLKPQMIQTQRSSVCSCQYSQSSSSHSISTSPYSCNSKHKQVVHSNRHQSNPYNPQLNCFPKGQGLSNNLHGQRSSPYIQQPPNMTSSETTPYKANQSQFNHAQRSHLSSKSPHHKSLLNYNSNQQLEERSLSFLKSTAQKKSGYNTDDLIRDSESEVDLDQVSNIILEAQNNFQEGFQKFVKHSQVQGNTVSERAQKEELAMQILMDQHNQSLQYTELNDSQVKTIKQSQMSQEPRLTIEALAQTANSNSRNTNFSLQTPVSNQNYNFNSYGTNSTLNNHPVKSNPIAQSNQVVNLNQQYLSPCFNTFEESNQQQTHPQQSMVQQSSDQSIKQKYKSVPVHLQKSSSGKSNDSANTFKNKSVQGPNGKEKRKHRANHLRKKRFNQEVLSESGESSYSQGSDKENSPLSPSSEEKRKDERKKSYLNKGKNKHNKKGQLKSQNSNNNTMTKVLKEMSIQTNSNNFTIADLEGCSSFLDKSDIQVQTEKPKSDAACQFDFEMVHQHQQHVHNHHDSLHKDQHSEDYSQSRGGKQIHQKQRLPLAYKRVPSIQKINAYQALPKSAPDSSQTSINSTTRAHKNNHFNSHTPVAFDDYYLHNEEETIQNQQCLLGGHSSKPSSRKTAIQQTPNSIRTLDDKGQHQHLSNQASFRNQVSQANIMPLNQLNQNFDHFKSQCSEVIIRGSSDTDISNRVLMYQNNKQAQQKAFQQRYNQHSHQDSGCQSLVNAEHAQRSQFASIETNSYCPSIPTVADPHKSRQKSVTSNNSGQSFDKESRYQIDEQPLAQRNQYQDNDSINPQQHQDEELFQQCLNYQNVYPLDTNQYQDYQQRSSLQNTIEEESKEHSENNNFYQRADSDNQFHHNSSHGEEEFNYTVRLNEIKNSENQGQRAASLPPVYGQKFNQNHSCRKEQQLGANSQLNVHGKQTVPQLTNMKPNLQIQLANHLSQPFQHSQAYTFGATRISRQSVKKMSFMEKVALIQRYTRQFLNRKRQHTYTQPQFSGGNSTILRPQEDSLSNISAQLLKSLKYHLNNSSNIPGGTGQQADNSYQRNILESLNQTTGNTLIRDTRQSNQGTTQQFNRERTQGSRNSSALVLYSGSTHDNRVTKPANDLQLGQLESQPSISKPPVNNDMDYQNMIKNCEQSPNNTSLLDLTDESNSAFFRLTPIASQNVTQKTNLFNGGNSTNRNEKTTESHNLNYSYSELESEWGGVLAMQNLNQGNPGSGNTTSSKIRNEGKVKKLAQREAQKLKLLKSQTSLQGEQHVDSGHEKTRKFNSAQAPKYKQRINIDGGTVQMQMRSPLSSHQIISTKSNNSSVLTKKEQLLNFLKSVEYEDESKPADTQPKQVEEFEWRQIVPVRVCDFDDMIMNLVMHQDQSDTQRLVL